MIRWRFPELLDQARKQSGEALLLPHIAKGTELSVSTVYMLTERSPKRIDVNTMDRLLIYLSHYLGPLTLHDLLEFELPQES